MTYQGYFHVGSDLHEVDNWTPLRTGKDAQADRPDAGYEGATFWNEDTGQLERDNGASWVVVLFSDAATNVASLRSLGTNAARPAAGDHVHS